MSQLALSFTFRLTAADKVALSTLAARWGCDRGAALRRLLRAASFDPTAHRAGTFHTTDRSYPIRMENRS